jgi:hypothetical protein
MIQLERNETHNPESYVRLAILQCSTFQVVQRRTNLPSMHIQHIFKELGPTGPLRYKSVVHTSRVHSKLKCEHVPLFSPALHLKHFERGCWVLAYCGSVKIERTG